jgi:hypothetical protein
VLRKQIDGIRLHAVNPAGEPTLTDVVLSYNVFIEPLPQSCLVTLYTGKKKKLTIQLVNNLHLRDDFQWKEVRNQNQGFITRDGFILHCPEKKAAIRVNEDTHWVTQGVRYYFY